MDSIKKISINDTPKPFRLLYLLLPVLGLLVITTELNNDFYFLYPTGEYIINNGFPVKDFLSMHTDMNIVVQQWACDVLFYLIYSHLGKVGMIAFVYICYLLFAFFMFRLCKLKCDNEFVAAVSAFAADLIIAKGYMTTRPQAISYLLFVLELLALEKYVHTKKKAYLIILPVISVLLINFHASMWAMLFIFALPFAAESIPFKFKKLKQEPCCSFVALLITGIICFAVGFINPYGIKAMTYIFTSFGYSDINDYIGEMEVTSVSSSFGILFFSIIAFMLAVIIITRKPNFKTRYVLMFLGTLVLALMNYKSVGYFTMLGIAAFSYYIKDFEPVVTINEGKSTKTKKEKTELAALGVLIIVAIVGAVYYISFTQDENSAVQQEESLYVSLDEMIEVLDTQSPDDIVLYTCFDLGPYFEFKGYHPYIDCRAELFFEKNNGEYDYLTEHMKLLEGSLYYKDFVDKYNFNYLVVLSGEYPLYNGLLHDDEYEIVLQSKNGMDTVYLFEKR